MLLNYAFGQSTQCALQYRDDCVIDTPIPFHFPYGKNLCEVDMREREREREREVNNRICVKRLKRGGKAPGLGGETYIIPSY